MVVWPSGTDTKRASDTPVFCDETRDYCGQDIDFGPPFVCTYFVWHILIILRTAVVVWRIFAKFYAIAIILLHLLLIIRLVTSTDGMNLYVYVTFEKVLLHVLLLCDSCNSPADQGWS